MDMILPLFPCENSMVLALTLKASSHCEYIFVWGEAVSFFSMWLCVISASVVEKTVLFPLSDLDVCINHGSSEIQTNKMCVCLLMSVVYIETRWGERKGERDLRNRHMQFGGRQAQIFRAGPQTWDTKEGWCGSLGPKTDWRQNSLFLGGPQSVLFRASIPPTLYKVICFTHSQLI